MFFHRYSGSAASHFFAPGKHRAHRPDWHMGRSCGQSLSVSQGGGDQASLGGDASLGRVASRSSLPSGEASE